MKTPFYGGYGLIAERNIPKAAYRVFELLHRLGDQRIPLDSENALVTQRKDGAIVVALWNYAEPDENTSTRTFRINVSGRRVTRYRMQSVDPDHGSAIKHWKAIGSPVSPTPLQIAELQKASALSPPEERRMSEPVTVPTNGLVVLELVL